MLPREVWIAGSWLMWATLHTLAVFGALWLVGAFRETSRADDEDAAEDRARMLLIRHLTPEQRHDYVQLGRFTVSGSNGNRYTLYHRSRRRPPFVVPHGSMKDERGRDFWWTLNAWQETENGRLLPIADQLLAMKLHLETDEASITTIGCRRRVYGYSTSEKNGIVRCDP